MIRLVHGKITEVVGGTSVDVRRKYLTADTAYTIAAQLVDDTVVFLENQVPQIRLWACAPDLELNPTCLEGVSVFGSHDDATGEIRWHFVEPPLVSVCQTQPAPPVDPLALPELRRVLSDRTANIPVIGTPGDDQGGGVIPGVGT